MTDETMDPRFERDLRALLAAAEPADAPASLYASVAAVAVGPRPRSGWASGRMAFAGLAMAAVVVIAVAAVALALRPWGDQPIVGGPTASPSRFAPADGGRVEITYQVMAKGGVQPGATDLEAVAAVLQARIDAALRADSLITTASPDRITVTVDMDAKDETAVSDLRQLLGATGHLDFVPLGDTPASAGDSLDLVAHPPLFSGDQVASATMGSDQAGGRTIDFTLKPEGARLFADYTAANIATYFAIVLDGTVISAPVINSAIPNGEVQISQGGEGGYPVAEAQSLVRILQSGELPFPIAEVAFDIEPASSDGPTLVTPVPSELILRPSPSPDASSAAQFAPLAEAARAYAQAAGIKVKGDGTPAVTVSRPDHDDVVLREVALPLDDIYAGDPQLRVWFDDAGQIAVVSNGEAEVSLEGTDIDAASAIEAAAAQLRLAGIDPSEGSLTIAKGVPGSEWYLTLSRSIDGYPVANTVMAWGISGDRAYVALRRDGTLRELSAIRPSHAPAPQVLATETLDAGLLPLSELTADELAGLHPALTWVRAMDLESGVSAPALTLGYCATRIRADGSWNGWCVDAGTGERSYTGGGTD